MDRRRRRRFQRAHALRAPRSACSSTLADLNGDGRLDIAAALNQGDGVAVLLNGCGQPAGNLVLSATDSPDPVAEGGTRHLRGDGHECGEHAGQPGHVTHTLSSLGVTGTGISSQGTCTITGRLVSCQPGRLAPGASADVQVTFTPSAATASLNATIGVGSELADSSPADNVVALTTAVTAAGRDSP